jgi:hypothetical protein
MNFNFGEVLTRAWQIIWKHKVLWIFGILASCAQGGGGGNGGSGSSYQTQNMDIPPQAMPWLNFIEKNLMMIIILGIAVICIIWILAIFLGTVGRIGLIRGTAQADGGAEKIIFGQLFSESMPYFWRMFGLSLIVAIPIIVIAGMFFAGIVVFGLSVNAGNDSSLLGFAAMIPLMLGCMCLFIPIMFVVGMIIRQAQNAIVLEDMSLLPALSRGLEVFQANLGPIIVMAIILAAIGFIIAMVIAIPIFLVVFPTTFAFILSRGQTFFPFVFMGICLCVYMPVAIVLRGILVAYMESVWTLTYIRITKKTDDDNAEKFVDNDQTLISGANA